MMFADHNVSICDAVMRNVKENIKSLVTDRPPRVQKHGQHTTVRLQRI